ncbi:MAG: flagellar hook-length control protein FliK [Oscillospiraceae bacterium]|nr:flagellar hook-length control protein FliK [Oscillospiraceae bacterium]
MNELHAIMPRGAQEAAGGQAKTGKSGGSDFSGALKKASERQNDLAPRAKREEPKPAEELVAYASAQQAQYTEKSDGDSGEAAYTAAVSDAAAPADFTKPPVIEYGNGASLEQALAAFGSALPPETGSIDITDFIAGMISEDDEMLGDFAKAVSHIQSDASAARSRRAERLASETAAQPETAEPVVTEQAAEPEHIAEPAAQQSAETAEPAAEAPEWASVIEEVTADAGAAARDLAPRGGIRRAHRHEHVASVQRHRERMAAQNAREDVAAPEAKQPVAETAPAVEAPAAQSEPEINVYRPAEYVSEEPRAAQTAAAKQQSASKVKPGDGYTNPYAYLGVKDSQVLGYDPITRTTVEQVVRQVVEAIRMAVVDGNTSMQIQLNPEALGKVSILLVHSEEGLTAQIKVADDRVNNMLNIGLHDLANSLKDMGINLKNIEITQSELAWDFTRGGRNGDAGNKHGRGGEGRRGDGERRASIRRVDGGLHVHGVIQLQDIMRLSSMLYGSVAAAGAETSVEFRA